MPYKQKKVLREAKMKYFVHKTAEVSNKVQIGEGTSIWNEAQIREGAKVGKNCIISKGVYIDKNVIIGNNIKIQNYSCIYHGSKIEDGVFIGPHVILTNDKHPRAINPDYSLKSDKDWEEGKILVKKGASIGANAVILPGTEIGEWALIGAGSVVTKNVPDYGLVFGNPAILKGFVCKCGKRAEKFCPVCKTKIEKEKKRK